MFSSICFFSREHQGGSTAAHAGESSSYKAGEEGRVGLGGCSPATAQGSEVWGHSDGQHHQAHQPQLWPQRRLWAQEVSECCLQSPPGLDAHVGKSALFMGQGRSWVASHSDPVGSTTGCLGLCQPCACWAGEAGSHVLVGCPEQPNPFSLGLAVQIADPSLGCEGNRHHIQPQCMEIWGNSPAPPQPQSPARISPTPNGAIQLFSIWSALEGSLCPPDWCSHWSKPTFLIEAIPSPWNFHHLRDVSSVPRIKSWAGVQEALGTGKVNSWGSFQFDTCCAAAQHTELPSPHFGKQLPAQALQPDCSCRSVMGQENFFLSR